MRGLGLLSCFKLSQIHNSIRNIYKIQSNFAWQEEEWTKAIFVRRCSNSSEPRKQLGGFVYKEEIEPTQSRWRKPFFDRERFWKSRLSFFSDRNFQGGILKFNPANLKYFSLKQWWFHHKKDKLAFTQKFIEERLNILGSDLAAAHFVVYRGGAVKFHNQSEWIRDDKKQNKDYDDKLPNTYKPEYILEAIDFSQTPILYEGLKNIERLKNLKWLSFERCPFFDNWCLDRITGEHCENLEFLNISYTNITWHALNSLYRFKNLKILKIESLSDDPEFYRMCYEIKRNFPELVIEGVPIEFLMNKSEIEASDCDSKLEMTTQNQEERNYSEAKA